MSRSGYRDPDKEQRWRKRLDQWRRSGLTVREFCLDHGLRQHAFYWWRRQIARRDRERSPSATAAAPLFVPLRVANDPSPPTAAAAPEVVMSRGRVVRVPPGFDAACLRQVLAVLEAAPC
jgi:transposase-like protein